jgi:hypothetical protein
VPPIDIGMCSVSVEKVQRSGTGGNVDCSAAPRSVLKKLEFSAD